MSEIKQHQQTVKAKRPATTRVTVPVSQTNYNRVKYGTHTTEKVLKLEGHVIQDGHVLMGERMVPIISVDLTARHKDERVVIPLVKKEAQPATIQAAANN